MEQIENKVNSFFSEMYNPSVAPVNNKIQNDNLWQFKLVIDSKINEKMTCKVEEEEIEKVF